MKIKINSTSITFLLVFLFILLTNSCTFIGLAIGNKIDKKEKDPYEVKPIDIRQLDHGKPLTILFKDGKTIEGKYLGTTQISQEQFEEQFSAFKKIYHDDLSLPAIGDTLEIFYTDFKTSEKVRFTGLETDMIIVKRLNSGKILNIPIASNEIFVYSIGKPFFPNNYNEIPYLTAIQLEDTTNNVLSIAVNDIRIIKAQHKKNGRLTGSMIGLVVDVTIIIVLLYMGSQVP